MAEADSAIAALSRTRNTYCPLATSFDAAEVDLNQGPAKHPPIGGVQYNGHANLVLWYCQCHGFLQRRAERILTMVDCGTAGTSNVGEEIQSVTFPWHETELFTHCSRKNF